MKVKLVDVDGAVLELKPENSREVSIIRFLTEEGFCETTGESPTMVTVRLRQWQEARA